ncbi:hypothetical protein F5Y04DRAFT_288913 [Hypomontagnella monticulosa]|nr:hypothetical protein F5Y04DRAFT_288913 [Hypomontagnella monticulosa]
MTIIKPQTGWLTLAVGLLAAQASAKDFQIAFWNSSSCTRGDPNTQSNIIRIPWDNDDPNAGIGCAKLSHHVDFNGWTKDTHNQQTLAYVDTHAIEAGCELVFYNQGPTPDQYPEQIAVGPCWQAYRRVSRTSSCPSVTFNADNFAVSYCCGDSCRVSRGSQDNSAAVFPAAPSLSNDLPHIGRDMNPDRAVKPSVKPRYMPRTPLRAAAKRDSSDVSGCKFQGSSPVRSTYLPSVQISDAVECQTGQDFGGAACSYDRTFSSEVSLMSTQSLSLSESIQSGLEGILTETTTFGFDGSSSATNGQTVSASQTLTLPQGRKGYPTFKQVVKCANGTWTGCDVNQVTSLPDQEYCVPVMAPIGNQGGNTQSEAVGMFIMVDTT